MTNFLGIQRLAGNRNEFGFYRLRPFSAFILCSVLLASLAGYLYDSWTVNATTKTKPHCAVVVILLSYFEARPQNSQQWEQQQILYRQRQWVLHSLNNSTTQYMQLIRKFNIWPNSISWWFICSFYGMFVIPFMLSFMHTTLLSPILSYVAFGIEIGLSNVNYLFFFLCLFPFRIVLSIFLA